MLKSKIMNEVSVISLSGLSWCGWFLFDILTFDSIFQTFEYLLRQFSAFSRFNCGYSNYPEQHMHSTAHIKRCESSFHHSFCALNIFLANKWGLRTDLIK